jgi:hypothetical protein
LIVALSLGHNGTTSFRPWSPIAPDRKSFGSCRKNSKRCSDDWHRWRFWSTFRHFGTNFAESFRMSKSSWMIDPTHSREMPSCSAIDLAQNPAVFQHYLVNWIGHCFGSSRTRRITGGKITTFKLGHPVFDGGIQWCMFLLQEKKTLLQLASRCCWNRLRRLTCFLSASVTRLCATNVKNMYAI